MLWCETELYTIISGVGSDSNGSALQAWKVAVVSDAGRYEFRYLMLEDRK